MSDSNAIVFDHLKKLGWELAEQDYSSYLFDKDNIAISKVREPFYSFAYDGQVLESNKPVEITLYFNEDCYVSENETLNIYAAAESIEEAKSEFIVQLMHFYRYYMSLSIDEVVGDAINIKNIYETHFKLQTSDAA